MCCFIGATPRTDWLEEAGIARDDYGFVLSGPDVMKVSGWTLDRPPITWKQVCPVCLLQEMCVRSPLSGLRPLLAKAQWR